MSSVVPDSHHGQCPLTSVRAAPQLPVIGSRYHARHGTHIPIFMRLR